MAQGVRLFPETRSTLVRSNSITGLCVIHLLNAANSDVSDANFF